MTEIRLEVDDLPPPKSQGSAMGPNSKYLPRVRALLEAAQQAIAEPDYESIGDHRLHLAVEVHSTPQVEPWDATNYLGGIADVLEAKDKRTKAGQSLEHLGDLAKVGLYKDDRQIKQISYKEVPSNRSRYVVTISALDT